MDKIKRNKNRCGSFACLYRFCAYHFYSNLCGSYTSRYDGRTRNHIAFGWLLGAIGNAIPGLNKFGGATILAMLVPATLVLFDLIPQNSLDAVNMLMSEANFLDLYVFALVSGSILGMNRNILVKGFARMALPMMTGFILALLIPSTIGWALGLGFKDTLFYIVTPA
ncbi:hypothetical protein CVR98_25030, partial [Salmonella enterica subsp. enterica serovar Enteritidis]